MEAYFDIGRGREDYMVRLSADSITVSGDAVKALNDVELLLPGASWVPRSGRLWFFDEQVGMLCFLFANSSVIIAFVATRQHARIHRAVSDMLLHHVQVVLLLSFLGPPCMVSVVFRLVRSWLCCNKGFWLRLFIARFRLADVG